MDWSSRELEVIDEYLLLVKNIVSVHTYYMSASLKMIVDHLKPSKNVLSYFTTETKLINFFSLV